MHWTGIEGTSLRMSLSRVNIKEANDHLKQVHQRVYELENQVHMQAMHAEELQKSNLELQHRLQEVLRQKEEAVRTKEAEVAELTQRLQESESRVHQLLEAAEERDATMVKLETKAQLFYEAVEHRTALSRILEVMEELSVGTEAVKDGTPGGRRGEGGGRGRRGRGDSIGNDLLTERPQVEEPWKEADSKLNKGNSSPHTTDR